MNRFKQTDYITNLNEDTESLFKCFVCLFDLEFNATFNNNSVISRPSVYWCRKSAYDDVLTNKNQLKQCSQYSVAITDGSKLHISDLIKKHGTHL